MSSAEEKTEVYSTFIILEYLVEQRLKHYAAELISGQRVAWRHTTVAVKRLRFATMLVQRRMCGIPHINSLWKM